MALSEELARLGELHQRGALSDDEFARAKARVLDEPASRVRCESPAASAINSLRRSREDAWLGGVCGGLAQSTGIATWAWRLGFTLLVMCAGTGVLLYALMWILLPQAPLPFDTGARETRSI